LVGCADAVSAATPLIVDQGRIASMTFSLTARSWHL